MARTIMPTTLNVAYTSGAPSRYVGFTGLLTANVMREAEAEAQIQVRHAGLRIERLAAMGANVNGGGRAVLLRSGGQDTSLAATLPDGAGPGAWAYSSGAYAPAVNEKLNFKLSVATGAGQLIYGWTVNNPHGPCISYLQSAGSGFFTPNRYLPLFGDLQRASNVELRHALLVRAPGVARNLQVYVSSSPTSGQMAVKSRVSQGGGMADGNQSIIIDAGQFGLLVDTSGSDVLAYGDRFGSIFYQPVASTGTTTLLSAGCTIDSNDNSFDLVGQASRQRLVNQPDHYFPLTGGDWGNSPSRASRETSLGFPARISHLRVMPVAFGQSPDAAVTLTLQVNGVDTPLTVTIPPTATTDTFVEDAVNTVEARPDDMLVFRVSSPGGTGGIVTIGQIGVKITDLTPVGSAAGGASVSGRAKADKTVKGSAVAGSATAGVGTFNIVRTAIGSAVGAATGAGAGLWDVSALGRALGRATGIAVSNGRPPQRFGAEMTIAIEITAAIDSDGMERTFHVADRAFVTEPVDTPANVAFDGSLINPGSIAVTAFGDGRTGGGTRLSYGEIQLINADGAYDDWLKYGFDGRPVVIRRGMPGAYPDDFATIFTGTIETLTVDRGAVVTRLRDKQLIFDRPALPNRYSGSNVLPNGVDGTEQDLAGTAKPRLLGKGYVIPAPCVNTAKLVYQISDSALESIDAVYDRGLKLTFGQDHLNGGALLAAAPAPGTYDTCLADGLFRLGGTPAGAVTADATQGAVSADRTAARMLSSLALVAGVAASDISEADVAALAADCPASLGVWISDQSDTFTKVMDEVAGSVGAYYAFDRNGALRMGRLAAPVGEAALSLEAYDILDLQRRPARDGDLPAWAYTIRHSRVWNVQSGEFAAAVTPEDRAFFETEYRARRAEDPSVKTQFRLAAEETADTLLTDPDAAAEEAARRLALYKVRRDFFDVTVPISAVPDGHVWLMDVVRLTHPRFGLAEGRLFRLLGIRPELDANQYVLTLWG